VVERGEPAEKAQIEQGRAAYALLEQAVERGPHENVRTLAAKMNDDPNVRALSVRERESLGEHVVRRFAGIALADHKLTQEEEQTFDQLLSTLGFGVDDIGVRFRDLAAQIR
jgi:hypothetical protein